MDAKASINYLVEKLATISESKHESESEEDLRKNEKKSGRLHERV